MLMNRLYRSVIGGPVLLTFLAGCCEEMFSLEPRPRAAAETCVPHLLLIALSLLWALSSSAAPKTDIVTFKNGDKLTGEFKSLGRGRLILNTEATGTIRIEWDKVLSVVSNQRIQVETDSGVRYFGNLTSSEEGARVVVVTDDGPQTLDAARVIGMAPIEGGGIHALDISLSAGYNFAKAGGVTQGNVGLNMDWRSLTRIESLRFSTIMTDSDTDETNKRANLGLQHTRLWKNRWFNNGVLSFEKNDELGLDLRSSLGAGVGRFLVQTNNILWGLEAGLQISRENLIDVADDTDSLEASLTARFDWFLFHDPEFDWSSRIQLIPSLTEHGRVRGELDTSLTWKIIGGLNWVFSLYGSWDNQPQSATGSTSDYGVNTNLMYKF